MVNVPEQILSAIKTYNSIVITSHIEPDGDSLGSVLGLARALSKTGKNIFVPLDSNIPDKYSFLAEMLLPYRELLPNPELAVVIDCSSPDRIDWGVYGSPPSVPIVNIDHHVGNMMFGDMNWVDENAAACGEMIYYLIKKLGLELDEISATGLFTAILTDTGRFSFVNTKPNIFRIAAELQEAGADPKKIGEALYCNYSPSYLKNVGIALCNLKILSDGKVAFMVLDHKNAQEFGTRVNDSEGIVDFAIAIKGVEVAALFKEVDDDKVKVSLRSRGAIDVSRIAQLFGGGGHKNAAGCTIYGSLKSAKETILREIERDLKKKSFA